MCFEQNFDNSKIISVIVERKLQPSSLLKVAYELFVANECLTERLTVAAI